ncbi:hypothetical protein KKA50_00925 [Patescibacteria group bacterium]|nr:hypothetical protein [Patescibacteria group bacterium]
MSASILKLYKYKNVREISIGLSNLFIDTIQKSSFSSHLKNTLLVPVPISNARRNERGFNQMEYITSCIGMYFNLDVKNDFIYCKNSNSHQANKTQKERYNSKDNPFYIQDQSLKDISKYKNITLVDDVITTGYTLEKITKVLKTQYGQDLIINALCIFRGKPYYLSTN